MSLSLARSIWNWTTELRFLLKAGDCVIQNGTRHAWHNRSSEKCVISVAIVGAERKPWSIPII